MLGQPREAPSSRLGTSPKGSGDSASEQRLWGTNEQLGEGCRDGAEMRCGGDEAAEVFACHMSSFSESLVDINTAVTHRKAGEWNCWKDGNQSN